jgi:hypothetical protein
VQLNLRISDKLDAPDRFQLTRYPGNNPAVLRKWDVEARDMEDDSCVVIYWDPKDIKPGQFRDLAFSYGLGSVSLNASKLSVTVGGATYKGGEMTVLALVSDRDAKHATLELPAGLKFAEGVQAKQQVVPMRGDRPSPVSWRVIAEREGRHTVIVSTDSNQTQSRRVTITAKSLFN